MSAPARSRRPKAADAEVVTVTSTSPDGPDTSTRGGASSPSIETDTSTDDAVSSPVVASFVEAVRVCTPVSTSDVDSEFVSESGRGGGSLEFADSAGAATATVAPTSTSALTLPMARRTDRALLTRLRHECSARILAMSECLFHRGHLCRAIRRPRSDFCHGRGHSRPRTRLNGLLARGRSRTRRARGANDRRNWKRRRSSRTTIGSRRR